MSIALVNRDDVVSGEFRNLVEGSLWVAAQGCDELRDSGCDSRGLDDPTISSDRRVSGEFRNLVEGSLWVAAQGCDELRDSGCDSRGLDYPTIPSDRRE